MAGKINYLPLIVLIGLIVITSNHLIQFMVNLGINDSIAKFALILVVSALAFWRKEVMVKFMGLK